MTTTIKPVLVSGQYVEVSSVDHPVLAQAFHGDVRVIFAESEPGAMADNYHLISPFKSLPLKWPYVGAKMWAMPQNKGAVLIVTNGAAMTSPAEPSLIDPDNLVMHLKTDALTAGLLSSWVDEVSAIDFTAAGSQRPNVVENALNGHPIIEPDGVDDTMIANDLDAFGLAGSTEFSIFFVYKPYNASKTAVFRVDNGASDVSHFFEANTNANDVRYFYQSTTADNIVTNDDTHVINQWRIMSIYRDATTLDMLVNGGTQSYQVASAAGAVKVNQQFWQLFANTTVGEWNGGFFELIVYKTKLSVANEQLVEGYLGHKAALNDNLVAGHPYKTDPPTV